MTKFHPLLITLFLTLSIPSLATPVEDEMAQRLAANYPATKFTSVKESPVAGIFEVVMGKNIAYVESSGKYFLFGHLFDMANSKDLTAERIEEVSKIDVSSLPLADAITVTQGTGAREFIVFADPECSFCSRLEKDLAGLKNIKIHTFVVPMLSNKSKEQAISIWCSKDKSQAWLDKMRNGKPVAGATCDNPMERNRALANKLRVNGTPSIIAMDGRMRAGYMEPNDLLAWLEKSTTIKQALVK